MTARRLALLIPLLAACTPEPPVKLHERMATIVAVQAQTLWDVSNKGTNEEGEPADGKLTTADWQALTAASQAMRETAEALIKAKTIEVAPPGQKILNEGQDGASTAAQVQKLIDGDRKGFAKEAESLRAVSDALYVASTAKDTKTLLESAGELDAICEACHVKFWYPQEVAAEKAAQATNTVK